MALTIEKALNDNAIEKVEKNNEGYSFWLKKIDIEISVILSINSEEGGYNFHLSHHIKTPSQIGVYNPGQLWGNDEAHALDRAVTAITLYYKMAIGEGHTPSVDWLVLQ